jgi:hypothetical protein
MMRLIYEVIIECGLVWGRMPGFSIVRLVGLSTYYFLNYML